MIEIGKVQKLQVTRKTEIGAYLNINNAKDGNDVLLPKNQMPQEIEAGDEVEVFVYINSEGKTIATTRRPKLTLGEVGLLKVVDTTSFGAFLDWGLEKDLLLPIRDQIGKIAKEDLCLVSVYFNNISNKICATMRIYDLLSTNSPYKKNQQAQGIVYKINKEIGAFVAVDNKYHGLILNKELFGDFKIGDTVQVRIKRVRDDGKLELSLRNDAYNEMESDAQRIMKHLKSRGGMVLINDKSSPEHIKAELNISKAAFKRAVGRLLKEGAITITEEGIKLRF